jgi:hypothetical protein
MNHKLYCSLVSLACFFYARYLNSLPKKDLTEDELRGRVNDITFYSLFGVTALLMSYF